ncbi:hypothetical protein BD413DRAFT_3033 [Trametes elegans]|nr:hypothetical protein BD413DRAFT_3033 [Trametes elegans]
MALTSTIELPSLSTSPYDMQPSPETPCVYQCNPSPPSFQTFGFTSDRQFPIYAHCNSQRKHKTPRLRCNTTHTIPLRRRQKDLMHTVDYRYTEMQLPPRSSFALSDIFEDEEDVEIEISPVLPSTPNTVSSVSTSKGTKARMKALLTGVALSIKATWGRTRSSRK